MGVFVAETRVAVGAQDWNGTLILQAQSVTHALVHGPLATATHPVGGILGP